ncbi:hypothetical protein LTR97_002588 [Elasticomyces elasticus]|uniref:Uncharacterized protein n=1 Tax=Elasticomyces elasticus TaxID=574655 RepID=A0AAN7WFC3_9PEZI|nr:hypothetical protein LTR97_002588 [Elasticomyces elasticus]
MASSDVRFVNYRQGDWSHWAPTEEFTSDDTTGATIAVDPGLQSTRKKRKIKHNDAELENMENSQKRADILRHREAKPGQRAAKKAKRDYTKFSNCPEMIAVRDYRNQRGRISMSHWRDLCKNAGLKIPPDWTAVGGSGRAEDVDRLGQNPTSDRTSPDLLQEEHTTELGQIDQEPSHQEQPPAGQSEPTTASEDIALNQRTIPKIHTVKTPQVMKSETGTDVIDLCDSDDEASGAMKVETSHEQTRASTTQTSSLKPGSPMARESTRDAISGGVNNTAAMLRLQIQACEFARIEAKASREKAELEQKLSS